MPHIPGHIDTSNSSFGLVVPEKTNFLILSLEPVSQFRDLQKGAEIGFLPIFLPWADDRFIVLASDLAPLKSYDDAEKWMEDTLSSLGSPNTMIEDATRNQLAKIKTKSQSLPPNKNPDLVLKMANYLSGSYLDKPYNGTKNHTDIIKWITDNAVPIDEMFSLKVLDRLKELVLAKKQV